MNLFKKITVNMMAYSKYQKLRCYQKYLCMNFKRKKSETLFSE